VLDVNTIGPMRVWGFLEHVARSERKLIVTLTSGMGSIADNTSGGAIPYRSSKAAVQRATIRSGVTASCTKVLFLSNLLELTEFLFERFPSRAPVGVES
jgi:hypothetical protein